MVLDNNYELLNKYKQQPDVVKSHPIVQSYNCTYFTIETIPALLILTPVKPDLPAIAQLQYIETVSSESYVVFYNHQQEFLIPIVYSVVKRVYIMMYG